MPGLLKATLVPARFWPTPVLSTATAVSAIAVIIPNFGDFLSIAGGLSAGVLAFILPPWMYNVEFSETVARRRYRFNWLILLFGVAGSVFSILDSVHAIIHEHGEAPSY